VLCCGSPHLPPGRLTRLPSWSPLCSALRRACLSGISAHSLPMFPCPILQGTALPTSPPPNHWTASEPSLTVGSPPSVSHASPVSPPYSTQMQPPPLLHLTRSQNDFTTLPWRTGRPCLVSAQASPDGLRRCCRPLWGQGLGDSFQSKLWLHPTSSPWCQS
jgi:hypothetical protein